MILPKDILVILPIGSMQVPVVECSTHATYEEAARRTMSLADYMDYLEPFSAPSPLKTSPSPSSSTSLTHVECLYLKDWHLRRDNPRAQFYSCPAPFRDDLLNLYFDRRALPPAGADGRAPVRDDYRFVYIGPPHSWYLNSYSTSTSLQSGNYRCSALMRHCVYCTQDAVARGRPQVAQLVDERVRLQALVFRGARRRASPDRPARAARLGPPTPLPELRLARPIRLHYSAVQCINVFILNNVNFPHLRSTL